MYQELCSTLWQLHIIKHYGLRSVSGDVSKIFSEAVLAERSRSQLFNLFIMKQQAFATQSITESIVAFAQFVRSHGLNAGIQETQDALLAAETGLMAHRNSMKHALKALFCHSPEERLVFEKLFVLFWDTNPIDMEEDRKNQRKIQGHVEQKANPSLIMMGFGETEASEEEAKSVTGANATERLKRTDLSKLSEMEAEWLEVIAARLFREMALRMRRRMKQSPNKGTISLRSTIRRNLSNGGEPIELVRRAQKPSKQRLIVLLDVSGSMDKYSFLLLRFICILRDYFRQLEAFVFSTHLVRVSKALKLTKIDDALALISDHAEHWSSGTKIGECLEQFTGKYGKQLLNGSPTIIILSDGLDTGAPGQVQEQLMRMRQRCKRIIWLNPLKGMTGYAPEARGMKEALPHLDTFSSAHSLQSLLELENILANA
jgi:uncharacterized protein with von Willebrand factor type A (vWA) domain